MLFDFLECFVVDLDYKVVYVLMLICIVMIIDFISGIIVVKINLEIEFKSKIGINGILRKVVSIVLLFFFIFLVLLVFGGVGVGLLYVLYVGYLMMEIKLIFENY